MSCSLLLRAALFTNRLKHAAGVHTVFLSIPKKDGPFLKQKSRRGKQLPSPAFLVQVSSVLLTGANTRTSELFI